MTSKVCARRPAAVMALAVLLAQVSFAGIIPTATPTRMQPAVLRGQFQQSRHLEGFKHALVSSGDFVLARGKGVIWKTRAPFASVTIITAYRLTTSDAGSATATVAPRERSQAAGLVSSLIMALVSADVASLSQVFEIQQAVLPDGRWRMDLVPRQALLGRVFAKIQLDGDRYVRSVHLEEKSGDVTDIKLSALTEVPAHLDAAELKQIE